MAHDAVTLEEAGHGEPLTTLFGSLFDNIKQTLALDEPVRDEIELARLVTRGFPARSIGSLIERGIPERQVFDFIIPKRTYQRRLGNQSALSPDESDKAERVARLLALATLVFADQERAARWLSTAKPRFQNRPPIELTTSSVGTKVVQEALLQAYFGLIA